ncbi:bifunctional 5,10-methylenetetrahydrofolate dehydrogenase/5,10-methenyltetrahydrofolate cyclohydrolase [Candidatus Parcubacteria bacterium]|nr:MAG: bifunctional 5,10-methylenetetrahydrofolate dehydrogenase/5,10-methenyltetrahydrofolate cyclohydrolase [Candidatus Parcubacteria bacterium]
MIISGREMAHKVLKKLTLTWPRVKKQPSLGIILVGENPASLSFIREKERAAETVGIDYRIYEFPYSVSTNNLKKKFKSLLKKHTAWIIQLPLPRHILSQEILDLIPSEKDADVLSAHSWLHFLAGSKILPPAVGAVEEIFRQYKVKPKGKTAIVVGFGPLVGQPVAFWLAQQKARVNVINEGQKKPENFLKKADIIVSGVGKAHLIRGDHIKKGAVVIDFGFAKKDGRFVGDVDFVSVAKRARIVTPVPGGAGPLTVAMLMKNIFVLTMNQK